jgi:hypothetical protein
MGGIECRRDTDRFTMSRPGHYKLCMACAWCLGISMAFTIPFFLLMLVSEISHPILLPLAQLEYEIYLGAHCVIPPVLLVLVIRIAKAGQMRVLDRSDDSILNSIGRLCSLRDIERVHICRSRFLEWGYYYVSLERDRNTQPYAIIDRAFSQGWRPFFSRHSDHLARLVGLDDAERLAQAISDFADIPITRSWQAKDQDDALSPNPAE